MYEYVFYIVLLREYIFVTIVKMYAERRYLNSFYKFEVFKFLGQGRIK